MLGITERRSEILRTLCRRRYETIQNLAFEFGVSERTIRRDIEALSLYNPIYTKSGRVTGGVYVVEEYVLDRMYMSESEIKVLQKAMGLLRDSITFNENDRKVLRYIISVYSKPKITKG